MSQFRRAQAKLISIDEAATLAAQLKAKGKRLVTTNGCFDLLHAGHVHYLEEARSLGDVLWVGLNSDSSVRALKGESRPVQDERSRMLQVAALESVDYVTVFHEATPVEFIRLVRPDVHAKGGDYQGKVLPEQAVLNEWGAELRLLSHLKGYSTTSILERLS